MGYRIGIDTGGTFTDLILVGPDGRVDLFKTPSTPGSPPQAIENGLALIAERLDIAVREFLARCDLIIHGTTVALNALIQLNGAKVGLFCTRGHEDSLEIRNGHKEDGHRYDFRYPAATMLVPRRLRVPVTERVLSDGRVRTPLDEDDVRRGVELFRGEGVEAVGVSFMWSFLHPEHERRVGEIVAEELAGGAPHALGRTPASDPGVHAHEHRRGQRLRRAEARSPHSRNRGAAVGARLLEPDPLRPVERRPDVGAGARPARRKCTQLGSRGRPEREPPLCL